MSIALVGGGALVPLLYAVSFALVLWTLIDVARRSPLVLSPGKKAAWIIGSIAGWLLFGVFGAIVALVYLVGPRRRMNAGWH
jgi:hypothetical protein